MTFGRWTEALLSARRTAWAALAVALCLAVAGIAQLRFDFSARAFFSTGDPTIAVFDEHTARWGEDAPWVLVVSSETSSVLEPVILEAVQDLVEVLGAQPETARITSFTRQLVPGPMGLGGQRVPVPLVASPAPAGLDAWGADALRPGGLVPLMVSEDGHHGVVLVDLDMPVDDLLALQPSLARLKRLAEAQPLPDGVQLSFTGVPALNAGVLEAVFADQRFLVPLAGGAMVLMLWTVFRTRRGVWIPGLAAALPLLGLVGLMGWLGAPIGALNQTFTVLIPVIAVADAIHLLSRYEEELAREDLDDVEGAKRRAIRRTFDAMGVACLFTSVTTTVGFVSLMAAQMAVLQNYGLFAGIGILVSFAVVIVVMPLALRMAGVSSGAAPRGHSGSRLERVARLAAGSPWSVLAVMGLCVTVCTSGVRMVHADFSLSELLGPEHSVTVTGARVDESLGGVLALEVGLSVEDGTRIDTPERLAALSATGDALATLDTVRAVRSPATLVAGGAWVMGLPPEIPDTQRRLDAVTRRIPAHERARMMTTDGLAGRMVVHVRDDGADGFGLLEGQLQRALAEHLAPVGVRADITGLHQSAYRGFRGVSKDLRRSVGWAFLSIGVLVALLFRSVRLGILAIMPNVVPLWVGLGVMGLMDWPLDQFTGVTLTIGLGLCVDNTIHLLSRFREECQGGQTPVDAIVAAVRHAGHALTLTTLVLGAGFALQAWSAFPGNQILGMLGALVILVAWVSNLVLVPALVGLGLVQLSARPE